MKDQTEKYLELKMKEFYANKPRKETPVMRYSIFGKDFLDFVKKEHPESYDMYFSKLN